MHTPTVQQSTARHAMWQSFTELTSPTFAEQAGAALVFYGFGQRDAISLDEARLRLRILDQVRTALRAAIDSAADSCSLGEALATRPDEDILDDPDVAQSLGLVDAPELELTDEELAAIDEVGEAIVEAGVALAEMREEAAVAVPKDALVDPTLRTVVGRQGGEDDHTNAGTERDK